MPDTSKITLGVEFECLLAICTYPEKQAGHLWKTNTRIDNERGQALIEQALSKPLIAPCCTCGELHTFDLPLNRGADSSWRPPVSTKWIIDSDDSVQPTVSEIESLGLNPEYYCFACIEIKTRILEHSSGLTTKSTTNPGHYHEVSFDDEIAAVLKQLASNFNNAHCAGTTRLYTNGTCGTHVHVGQGNAGFPLDTVKKIMSLHTACECQIDGLHSLDRISGNAINSQPFRSRLQDPEWEGEIWECYNLPLSSHFIHETYQRLQCKHFGWSNAQHQHIPAGFHVDLSNYPQSSFGDEEVYAAAMSNDIDSWLKLVNAASNLLALQQLNPPAHWTTVNLGNLSAATKRRKGWDARNTIEFRQHRGTLDFTKITAWIDFLVNLVTQCHDMSQTDCDILLKAECGSFRHPEFGTLKLLEGLRCSSKTVQYYRARLSQKCKTDDSNPLLCVESLKASEEPLLRLANTISKEEAQNLDQEQIRARIQDKITQGCYGQFTASYLKIVLPAEGLTSEVLERLQPGHVTDIAFAPDPEERRNDYSCENLSDDE